MSASSVILKTPSKFFTDDQGQGTEARLQVDVAQTSFFTGREFRTFKEWSALTTATYVVKAVTPINIILFGLGLEIDDGTARVETVIGGTEGGTFSETLPVLARNTMSEVRSPVYESQVTLTAGGTLTGGTVLDVIRLKANQATAQRSTVGAGLADERGVGAGTYYFRVTLSGVTGVLRARWEERPEGQT